MTTGAALRTTRKPTALERNLLGIGIQDAPLLLPGLALAAVIALIATWLAEVIGTRVMGMAKSPLSSVTVAVLLGLFVNNALRLPAWLQPGIGFSVKKLLRLGIILLGIRLSLLDVARLGANGLPVVLLCILSALLITAQVGRWLKLPARLSTLIAVGTSICGVSAIVATAGAIDAEDEEVAYAVSTITLFGLVATFIYPYLAHTLFAGNGLRAGLFLGTSIHDTSQVTGAAMIFAETFGLPQGLDAATVAKLVRNVFMAAVIPFVALAHRRRHPDHAAQQGSIAQMLPLFVVGFVALATLRTIGDAGLSAGGRALGVIGASGWKGLTDGATHWASNLLTVALAGVGLSTKLKVFKGLGLKPLAAGLGAALAVGVVSALGISLFGAVFGF